MELAVTQLSVESERRDIYLTDLLFGRETGIDWTE